MITIDNHNRSIINHNQHKEKLVNKTVQSYPILIIAGCLYTIGKNSLGLDNTVLIILPIVS